MTFGLEPPVLVTSPPMVAALGEMLEALELTTVGGAVGAAVPSRITPMKRAREPSRSPLV